MESSSSSSKRGKAPVNNISVQVSARCLADGCNADLSLCRDYHRRHKVCEIHSKTPKVTIAGREQRFCQQCSRFHSLVEFDEGKRSCRKRLDGHNRRRRKPPPPQPDSSLHRVFSTQPPLTTAGGGRLLSFSSPPPPPPPNSILASTDHMMLYEPPPMNYNSFPEQSYKAINQLQFQFIHTNDDYPNDRALSLLSPAAPPHPVHNYFHHYPALDDQETKPPLVVPRATDPRMMFQAASEGPSSTASANGSHQTLTFMWE